MYLAMVVMVLAMAPAVTALAMVVMVLGSDIRNKISYVFIHISPPDQ